MAVQGRNFEVDPQTLIELAEMGLTHKDAAKEVGCTPQTISRKISDLQRKQGLLLQYRSLQSLQLTELQVRVLDAITPEKINDAPLRDLIVAFKILKDKELNLEGKPTDIKGLVAYLIELEKEEVALMKPVDAIDAEHEEVKNVNKDITDSDYVPEV